MKGICASSWTITKNHCMMQGQQNVKFKQVSLGNHSELDTCLYEYAFLTKTDTTIYRNIDFSFESPCIVRTMSDSFREKKQRCREISDSYTREVERTNAFPVARCWRSLVIRISVLSNADVSNSCSKNIVSSCSVSLSADWDAFSQVVSYWNVIQTKYILRSF